MRPNLANHSNGFDMSEVNRSKVALLPDDIIEKYKEAISHYAKVGFLFLFPSLLPSRIEPLVLLVILVSIFCLIFALNFLGFLVTCA